MPRRRARDLTVGTVFALSLVIVALAIMAVGGKSGMFFAKVAYYSVFPAADGLLVGAPVRMAGVTIGTVSGIHLPTDPASAGIEVRMEIDPDYAARVRADSRSALRILQLLTSEKFVEIVPGSEASEVLLPGSEIPRQDEAGVFEQGERIAENLTHITVALRRILDPLERGEGLLGQMLHDPEFGREGLEALGSTLASMQEIGKALTEGRGVAGRLLHDVRLGQRLDDLVLSLESFSAFVQDLSQGQGQGALGDLLTDGGVADEALLDLRESAASLRRLTGSLESDRGVLGRLLNDPEYSEAVATDLAETLRNVAEITAKINRGDGTLGALVNDSTIHDGASEIVDGVNDSKFARWLLRHYRKKGIKAANREAPDEEAPGGADR